VKELLGYSPEEVIGKTSFEFMPQDEAKRIRKWLKDIMASQKQFTDLENINIHKTGHHVMLEMSGSPILNEEGGLIGYRGLARDITHRKRTEEEMRRLRNLLSNIVNSMPSVLVGVDMEGNVTQWNREAERVTGITDGEAQGRVLTEVFPQLSEDMENVRQAIRARQTQKNEKILREIDGETYYWDITTYPLIINGAEGAVIRVDNVTDRVHLEEMMIQAEKMVSVGGLAAGMAHEINNPLGIILQSIQNTWRRFSLELKKNQEIAEECGTNLTQIHDYLEKRNIFQYLQGIHDAGLRASKIVANMLSFSRRSESEMAPADINQLLETALELALNDYDLKKKYDFRHINIIRDYDETLTDVPCTATEIEQVVLNLLKNSAQAFVEKKKERDEPQIKITTHREPEYARIDIEDNGPGMDGKTRRRIFEPFYTTKPVGTGIGLGLSVSYFIIVTHHKGEIHIDSKPGKGTKFTIQLPLER
jgi:PAS domain S-box-containing protein